MNKQNRVEKMQRYQEMKKQQQQQQIGHRKNQKHIQQQKRPSIINQTTPLPSFVDRVSVHKQNLPSNNQPGSKYSLLGKLKK